MDFGISGWRMMSASLTLRQAQKPGLERRLLERIKHLFDVEGVAFILLVNRKQIESYFQSKN
jgi:hypothetical protein